MTLPLDALVRLLHCAPYRGQESDNTTKQNQQSTSLEALESRLQMSRAELHRALRTTGAICIDGQWRLLEQAYSEQVLDAVLDLVTEEDLPLDAVLTATVASGLPQFETQVVEHVLGLASEPRGDAASNSNSQAKCALDLRKVAQHRAHQLFRRRKERNYPDLWAEDDFMAEWSASMPGLELPDPEALMGVALREGTDGGAACLRYVPAAGLPSAAAPRLAALFELRPKWRLDDLRPYLKEIEAQGGKVEDLLLQHTRSSVNPQSNERLYSAR